MTLHPWPLNDDRSNGDPAAVLWTGRHGLGLFSDSLAVPLCFLPQAASFPPAVTVKARAADTFNSSALFRLREMGSRFGAGN